MHVYTTAADTTAENIRIAQAREDARSTELSRRRQSKNSGLRYDRFFRINEQHTLCENRITG